MTNDEQIALLNQRLERLESIEAIRTLRCRYHDLVNLDQGARLYELFAPDATIAYGGRPEVTGKENIREFFRNFPVQVAMPAARARPELASASSTRTRVKSFFIAGRARRCGGDCLPGTRSRAQR